MDEPRKQVKQASHTKDIICFYLYEVHRILVFAETESRTVGGQGLMKR